MKKLLLALITTTLLTQVFAGELINRRTGDSINFELNRTNLQIEIYSTSGKVGNKTIALKNIQKDHSKTQLLALSSWNIGTIDEYAPFEVFLLPLTFTADILLLPFKAPLKLIQNMKMKKDFRKLKMAINSTKTIMVSNKRFERIENLLSN